MFAAPHGHLPPLPIGLIIAPKQPQGYCPAQPLKQESVPLKYVVVKAQLTGYVCSLDSVLKYSNKESEPAEVLFRFPVDEAYAVVGLEAVLGGRRIRAAIKEKEEAKQDYDDAMASGFTAALGEEQTGDIFSISLGNLPPDSDAEIHLQLVGQLPLDADGAVLFTLPSVLKPRYTPMGSTDPLALVSGPATQTASLPAVFSFSMKVLNPQSISEVTSPTHSITTLSDGEAINVSMGEPKPLDKDLVITVSHTSPHTPTAIVESADGAKSQCKFMGSPAVMLNFFPKFEKKRAAYCEFIFVIDRSGSMSGGYMKSAKETLKLFLQSIPPGCHFNIIGFGSSYEVVFGWSEEYTQHSLQRAIEATDQMYANLGGTELLEPLKHIYSQPLLPGLPRQVFVLTDGSVSNTSACIMEVKNHSTHTRVFTFGIGSGASTELVRGLAKAGNGTAEFIHEGERMQPKVIASLKRALQPAVTELRVSFTVPSGFDVLQAPSKVPVIFNGDKTTLYGIFKSKALSDDPLQAPLSGSATLKGNVLGKAIEHHIPFTIPEPSFINVSTATTVVHQLAAKALIQDKQSDSTCKQEVIDLSIESSVISAHTAYIAIDEEQDKPIEGAVKVWDVLATSAQQSTRLSGLGHGAVWFGSAAPMGAMGGPPPPAAGGLFGRPPPLQPQFAGSALNFAAGGPPPPPAALNFAPGGPPPPPPAQNNLFDLLSAPPPLSRGLVGGPPAPPPPSGGLFGGPPQPTSAGGLQLNARSVDLLGLEPTGGLGGGGGVIRDGKPRAGGAFGGGVISRSGQSSSGVSSDALSKVLSLQHAQGYWELEQAASLVLHLSLGVLTDKCPVACEPNVWATVLVLAYLELKFAAQKDEWELVAMKGEMWLEGQVDQSRLTALQQAAKTCI